MDRRPVGGMRSRSASLAASRCVAGVALRPAARTVYKCADAGGVPRLPGSCPARGQGAAQLRHRPAGDLGASRRTPASAAPARAPASAARDPRDDPGRRRDRQGARGDAAGAQFIRPGMTEGRGPRARSARPMDDRRQQAHQRRWTYLPAAGDPETVTTVCSPAAGQRRRAARSSSDDASAMRRTQPQRAYEGAGPARARGHVAVDGAHRRARSDRACCAGRRRGRRRRRRPRLARAQDRRAAHLRRRRRRDESLGRRRRRRDPRGQPVHALRVDAQGQPASWSAAAPPGSRNRDSTHSSRRSRANSASRCAPACSARTCRSRSSTTAP